MSFLDLINSRLSDDKKMTLAQFESIAAGDCLLSSIINPAIQQSSHPFPDGLANVTTEAHRAIMETTCDLAASGDSTPTQLLALQRLADFPARAEYREHKRQLELRKEQRAAEKQAHKKEMDAHR